MQMQVDAPTLVIVSGDVLHPNSYRLAQVPLALDLTMFEVTVLDHPSTPERIKRLFEECAAAPEGTMYHPLWVRLIAPVMMQVGSAQIPMMAEMKVRALKWAPRPKDGTPPDEKAS